MFFPEVRIDKGIKRNHKVKVKLRGVKKVKKDKNEPTVAPGLDNDQFLDKEPSKEDRKKGNVTNVTTYSWDEVDPS
ncbi:hypothetical protein CUU66_02080 [Peribacillus deserti]|uniref:Uncharacterized protein n=1 Tax=Peribacillus deserti TaxID=673318 RepID=A0A2N5MAZ2_9BACI|nr:hypothetical protein CUU66_02080 [Peribacillus deserti]